MVKYFCLLVMKLCAIIPIEISYKNSILDLGLQYALKSNFDVKSLKTGKFSKIVKFLGTSKFLMGSVV